MNYIQQKRDKASPKQMADALGHNLDTHLKSYSRFNTKELENSFYSVICKLENKVVKVENKF